MFLLLYPIRVSPIDQVFPLVHPFCLWAAFYSSSERLSSPPSPSTAATTSRLKPRRSRGTTKNDALVRALARSAHDLVVEELTAPGTTRFRTAAEFPNGFRAFEHGGGRVEVVYEPASGAYPLEAGFSLTATLDSVQHTLASHYRWRALEFPSPLMVEAPYLHVTAAGGATIRQNDADYGALYDRGYFDLFELESLGVSFDTFRRNASQAFGQVQNTSSFGVEHFPSLLSPYNTPSISEIFAASIANLDAGDPQYPNDWHIYTPVTVGSPDDPKIVFLGRDVSIHAGGSLRGYGVLISQDDVIVEPGARLEWDGIVMARHDRGEDALFSSGRRDDQRGLARAPRGAPTRRTHRRHNVAGTWMVIGRAMRAVKTGPP